MEVRAESDGAVSSLHSDDGAGVGVGNALKTENAFGSFAEQSVVLARGRTHKRPPRGPGHSRRHTQRQAKEQIQ